MMRFLCAVLLAAPCALAAGRGSMHSIPLSDLTNDDPALVQQVMELKKELGEMKEELAHMKESHSGFGKTYANGTVRYNDTLTFLLNQFHMNMPRSYQDILPVSTPGQPGGTLFWTTPMYLEKGAFAPKSATDLTEVRLPLDAIEAVQERALSRYGLNLYDGATWQLAMTIAGRFDIADSYEWNVLYTSQTGSNPESMPVSGIDNFRANKDQYYYGPNKIQGKDLDKIKLPGNVTNIPVQQSSGFAGDKPITEMPGGLFIRMVTPTYKLEDPFTGYFSNSWKFPSNNDSTTKWNVFGVEHLNDWKPIMGENAWAAFTGPLQKMYMKNCTQLGGYNVSHDDNNGQCLTKFSTFDAMPPPMQLGLSLLPGIKELTAQSPAGGSMYHCPKGSALFPKDDSKCDGKECGEETNISNENNVSAYAGFKMLWQLLFNMTDSSGNDEDITNAKTEMTKLVQGLEKFFKNYLVWKSDKTTNPKTGRPLVAVPQGGHITFNGGGPAGDGYFRAPVEVESGYAADCTTWGVGVLGVDFIDGAFGDGTAYDLWQTTKLLTGYFDNATGDLGGIAYTNYGCSNKTNGEFFEDCDHSYWSAEWTFGAINMCERAATEYESKGNSDYAAEMRADAESMRKTIKRPMTRGPGLEWTGGGLVQEDGSYLYSNKRFFIPWGWYANPVGALCSSSWAVLDEFKYNPFVLGGGVKSPIPDPTTEQLRAHAEHHKKLFGEEPGFEY